MSNSLWGDEFKIETTKDDVSLLNKINSPQKIQVSAEKVIKSKTVSIEDKLSLIKNEVNRVLGIYKNDTIVIKTKEELVNYIDKSIENGIIAIDTETNNSLDPITCKLMGPCIYTPGLKNAYIPINHTTIYETRLDWQLTEEDIQEQFNHVVDSGIKVLMHNGKFDYEVIKCTCGVTLPIYWDTMIAAKVIDENEKSAGLKQQYIQKIDPEIEKYSIDKLFEGVQYAVVDPDIFALYAATDAYMTYKLYEYQYNILSKPENKRLLDLLFNVEFPIVIVSAEMELTGVCIDEEYSKRLSRKYNKLLDDIDIKINEELDKYTPQIEEWRTTTNANRKYLVDKTKCEITFVSPEDEHKYIKNGKSILSPKTMNEQLKSPPELTSAVQLAILLYDVIGVQTISKKLYRSTGEEVLKQIDLPLCKLILEKRTLIKLINTYIDKLPQCLSPKDGRLHAHFNQYGADTGRFSSSDPNLQNIPSHNNSIRMMFTASDGYTMLGSDFSQQEPRLLSHFSNDTNMINAYKEGKDLYAMIASKVYHNNYEDNLEFNPITKQMQPDGKKRRTSVKGLLLGRRKFHSLDLKHNAPLYSNVY